MGVPKFPFLLQELVLEWRNAKKENTQKGRVKGKVLSFAVVLFWTNVSSQVLYSVFNLGCMQWCSWAQCWGKLLPGNTRSMGHTKLAHCPLFIFSEEVAFFDQGQP